MLQKTEARTRRSGRLSWLSATLRGALGALTTASGIDPGNPLRVYLVADTQERLGMKAQSCVTWKQLAAMPGNFATAEARRRIAALGCR